MLPVYGLHSGIETAYALILVSLFAVASFAFQPFIGWIGDRFTFKTIAIFVAAVSSLVVPSLLFAHPDFDWIVALRLGRFGWRLLHTGHAQCGAMFQGQRSDCGKLHVRDGPYRRHGRGSPFLQPFNAGSRPFRPFGTVCNSPGFFHFSGPETGKCCDTMREQNITIGNVLDI